MDDTRRRLAAAIRDLTRDRGPTGSICPSEAARAVGGDTWRELMGQAREVARELARAGDIEVTQRGRILDPDDAWRGPIRLRIRRPEPDRTAAARGTCR
ncbi:DUF3253 domain-containing protein [Mycolicibacterium thermoresistibile]